MSGRAGSRRKVPGWGDRAWRAARQIPAVDDLDDDHGPAAARAWRARMRRFGGRLVWGGRREREQLAGAFEVGFAGAAGEQAIVADAVEPARQAVQQEAADELVGAERHDLLPVWCGTAIVLVAERDPMLVEPQEATVRDGDPVSVAREIGEHGFGTGEGRLGVDHPALFAHWREVAQECAPIGEMSELAEEGELAGIVERHEPGEEQACQR